MIAFQLCDSGAKLSNHRAWFSWRYLSSLQLPQERVWQLPLLSTELQNLIENVRSHVQHKGSVDAVAVGQILRNFLHDSADSHAK